MSTLEIAVPTNLEAARPRLPQSTPRVVVGRSGRLAMRRRRGAATMSKSRSQWSKGARKTIPAQFAPRLVEMLESPAWRVLSLSAHRLLDRLDIEHRHHAGRDNGKLIVTFEQFCGYGMDRHAVARAIRETVALGFVEVTRQGCAGNADQRQASQYRLTYQPAEGVPGYGSNEWRTITTLEEANRIAADARRTPAAGPNGRRVKNRNPMGVNATFQCAKPPPKGV